MSEQRNTLTTHLRKRILTGFLLIAPLGVTVIILKFLFSGMANVLAPIVKNFLGQYSSILQALVSFALLVALLYLIGLAGTNLAGRWMISVAEKVVSKIPLVRTVYSSARQVIHTFGSPKNSSFERVVWVQFPMKDAYAIGFVTGEVKGSNGETLLKVFVSTAPNPTSGFLILVKPNDALEAEMSVETAIQMILSGGIVSPEQVSIPSIPTNKGVSSWP